MTQDARPVIAAFDGSPESTAAVREAAMLFGGRPLLVATVWEPGLAMAVTAAPDAMGMGMPYALPSPEEIETVDRVRREHAAAIAETGAQLARSLGASAEPVVIEDAANVGGSVAALAEQRDAAAIVVGSRGLGAVKARLLGSTSRRLLHDAPCSVVVVPPHRS